MNLRSLAIGLICLCFTSAVFAQTDPAALLVPFPPGQNFQLQGNALFEENGHAKKSDDDFRVSVYESQGRWQLTNQFRINPTIGYDTRVIRLDKKTNAIPDTLSDTSLAIGGPLHQFGNGWFLAGVVGVGYAGDNAFGNGDAYYGKATAIVGKELGPDSSILIGLDYNGNRSAYPDIPLPGFAYSFRLFPTIVGAVGFPYSSIKWEPTPQIKVKAGYSIPDSFDASVEYEITKNLRLVATYEAMTEPFHVDQVGGHDRLFYCHNGVEAGVKFKPEKQIGISAAIGYQFGQEFNRGWDSTDMDRIVAISDEPYLRVGIDFAF